MVPAPRIFLLPNQHSTIRFEPPVLSKMYSFAQRGLKDKEAGGQLFVPDPSSTEVLVTALTGPYATDRRHRTGWVPDVRQLKLDRENNFAKGLYTTGLWHTHPEPNPKPSDQDRRTCHEHLNLLDQVFDGYLLVTVGNSGIEPAISLFMAQRRNQAWFSLKEVT